VALDTDNSISERAAFQIFDKSIDIYLKAEYYGEARLDPVSNRV
jgi:hypothetical protein